jgi:WD40 repeat protein
MSIAPDRRDFIATAVPLAFAVAAGKATSPPFPVPAKVGDLLPAPASAEVLPLPAGATGRLGSPRMRVNGYVNKLQFSPKGTTLVVASGSEVRAWDPRNGKVSFRVGYPKRASVDSGRLTSRDTFVLLVRPESGGQYEIHHYTFGAGKLVAKSPPLDLNQSQHTAFSVDGTLMALVRQEGLAVHDTDKGSEKWRVSLAPESIGGLKFFVDGSTLALATKGEIKLFNVATGKLSATLSIQETGSEKPAGPARRKDWLDHMAISADGRWIAASVGEEAEKVCVIDVKSGKVKHTFKPAARPIDFTPDGSELLTIKDGTATFWTIGSGTARSFEVPDGDALLLSPDGKILATSAGDAVMLIDARTGKELPYSADPPGLPNELSFAGGSRLLGRLDDSSGWVEWNLSGRTSQMIRIAGLAGMKPVALSRDRRTALVRRDSDYSLRDVATGRTLATHSADRGQDGVGAGMASDGRFMVVWKQETLEIVPANGGKSRTIKRAGASGLVSKLVVSRDGRHVAVALNHNGLSGAVDIYDLTTDKHVRRIETRGDSGHIAFSTDGDWLVVAHDVPEAQGRFSSHGTATVFDVLTGTVILTLPPDDDRNYIVALSPDRRLLARLEKKESDKETHIALWEVLAGTVRVRNSLGGSAAALAFSPDGRTLAASVYGAPVFLWDLHAGPKIAAPDRDALERSWSDLLKPDAAVAFAAVRQLAAFSDRSAPFLRQALPPVSPPDRSQLDRLIADLEHKEFRKREAASKELAALGERARGALRRAADGPLEPETRERVERLLAAAERTSPEFLRMIRALEAMEVAATPDAVKLIERWAGGADGANFTRQAQAALKRIRERTAQ